MPEASSSSNELNFAFLLTLGFPKYSSSESLWLNGSFNCNPVIILQPCWYDGNVCMKGAFHNVMIKYLFFKWPCVPELWPLEVSPGIQLSSPPFPIPFTVYRVSDLFPWSPDHCWLCSPPQCRREEKNKNKNHGYGAEGMPLLKWVRLWQSLYLLDSRPYREGFGCSTRFLLPSFCWSHKGFFLDLFCDKMVQEGKAHEIMWAPMSPATPRSFSLSH